MSDLITLRNGPSILVDHGDPGPQGGDGEIIAEGIDTENPKANSARKMTAENLQKYAAGLAYSLALQQLSLANQLYCNYLNLKSGDFEHFKRVQKDAGIGGYDDINYKAQVGCAMSIAKQSVARNLGRKMHNALNVTDMYSSGLKRSIIEDTFATLIDEAGPLAALAYRDEYNLDDRTYLESRANAVSSMDKSNMYVGASALQRVANTQVDLALYAADARNTESLNKIDDVLKLVTNAGNFLKASENILFKAKSETGASQSYQSPASTNQFGTNAPVRPDNPEGFTPIQQLPQQITIPESGTSVGGEFTSTPGGVGGV